MTCGGCGAGLAAGDRFCVECGAAAVVCPACGEPAAPSNRFCRACGQALAGTAPGTAAAARARPATVAGPVAERRVCSVLFCDVVGFTPLSEAQDPEAVRELLSQYFDRARTVIGRYGGVVEKFIGDAVMARWAWPLAARAAHDLADPIATAELLALLDGYRPGQLAPMQRAERDLARARLTAAEADPTDAAFTAAITGLRQHSTPYHLAHGLLDHAEHLLHSGDDEAAEAATGEARGIAQRLGCQPLLDRADTIQPARPSAPAPEQPHRPSVESAGSALLHTEPEHA